jgi:translation initiation factor 2 subunit 2
MKMDYEELLKRARSQLPSTALRHERFEIPKPRSFITGMRTIVQNFKEMCDALNREPQHVLKFLSKEMATAGTMDGARALFKGKFGRDTIERLISRYNEEFVRCPVCKLPDTKIVKERRLYFLKCEACGARSSMRPL